MTNQQYREFNALSQFQQVRKFKAARKALDFTQGELGARLRLYGYEGGISTVQKWEQGLCKIPPLVYNLVFEGI